MADILPDWFSLDRYRAAANFTPEQWGEQIHRRLIIQALIDTKDQDALDAQMRALVADPLMAWPSWQRNGSRLLRHLPYTTPTIYPLTFHNVHGLASDQQRLTAGDASACDEVLLDRFAHLVVDLDARDDQIKQDFSRWLKAYRKASGHPAPKPLDQVNLHKWHRDKVLPFFDLTRWAQWSSTRLSPERLLFLLFPAYIEATSEHLKAVKKQVDAVISWSTHATLSNLEINRE